MSAERLFLDTSFVQAFFNRQDQYHQAASQWAQHFNECRELWTTEAILLEIGAAFRELRARPIAIQIWDQFQADARCRLAAVSGSLLKRAMQLLRDRPDKDWSLTDCASFVVMSDQHLTEALSCDHHFVQAGFRALLLEQAPE